MIKIYTTPVCAYCNMAKEYFKSKNFEYQEVPLIGNEEAQKMILDKTGNLAVPVIEIKGKYIVGFNRQAIDEAMSQ